MTTTANRKTVRETSALVCNRGRLRPVVVTLTADRIILRLKGERRSVELSAGLAYHFALNAWVQADKARRRAEQSSRKRRT